MWSWGQNTRPYGIAGISAIDPPSFDEITIRARPYLYRLVFEIPGLPNLPELPSRRTNLFDHPIPFVRVNERPGQLVEAIGALTQYDATLVGDRRSSKRTPLEFENVTARELVEFLHAESGPGQHVLVDRNEKAIIIGADEPESWTDRLPDWLKSMLP